VFLVPSTAKWFAIVHVRLARIETHRRDLGSAQPLVTDHHVQELPLEVSYSQIIFFNIEIKRSGRSWRSAGNPWMNKKRKKDDLKQGKMTADGS
jgi:hypothetical protein